MFLQPDGKLAGCWVMRIEEPGERRAGRGGAEDAAGDDAEQREKVIVRSNGTVTYVGKDMAYQFWKLGLLGYDFHYRPFAHTARRQRPVGDDQRPGAGPDAAPGVRRRRAPPST